MSVSEKPNDMLVGKYEELKSYLHSLESVAVAFSSGVDSTFLLYAAKVVVAPVVLQYRLVVGHLFDGKGTTESNKLDAIVMQR